MIKLKLEYKHKALQANHNENTKPLMEIMTKN